MKIYKVIIEDGQNVYKEYIPAKSKKDLVKSYGCNGNIVLVIEINDYLLPLSYLNDILSRNGFNDIDIAIISRTLQNSLDSKYLC